MPRSILYISHIFLRLVPFLAPFLLLIPLASAGPSINYNEILPGTTMYQSQVNGWNSPPAYSQKDIITPESISAYVGSTTPQGCRRITTSAVAGRYFPPHPHAC